MLFRSDSPTFDRNRALDQQIRLLELKKEHLENLIDLARGIRFVGVKHMTTDFRPFDTKKIDEYAREAKASWGNTPEWKEYEQKSKGRTKEQTAAISEGMMDIFRSFGAIREGDPASAEAHVVQLCCDCSTRRWDAFWRLVNYCSRRAEIEHGRRF